MTWAFVFMMVVLKIPLVALLWLVWWAVREVPAPEAEHTGDDGGSPVPGPHPRPRRPRPPRRGPHGGDAPSVPPRVRSPGRGRPVAGRRT